MNTYYDRLPGNGLQIADPSRILQITDIPAPYKPITWAEKESYRLRSKLRFNIVRRNKWIVYPISILASLIVGSLMLLLALFLYTISHADPRAFSSFGWATGMAMLATYLHVKFKLEDKFPIEELYVKIKGRHGHK